MTIKETLLINLSTEEITILEKASAILDHIMLIKATHDTVVLDENEARLIHDIKDTCESL